MIRIISNYSELPSEEAILEMIGKQMSYIGSSPESRRLKTALKNALKSDSRAKLFLSVSDEGELQGFAFANVCSGLESGADYLWINELHINQEFRNKGLAEELLESIEQWAEAKGMPYMACITSSSNKAARKLYEKKGFEISETLWVDKTLKLNNTSADAGSICIRRLDPGETPPMELLLIADPSEKLVKSYLSRGICLVAELENTVTGALILMPTEKDTMEIMNVSVSESRQNRGIGAALVNRAVAEAKISGARRIEIGTGNPGFGQMYLYQKCGFRIDSVDKDFFRRNYPERIYENGLECRDMIRLALEFK